MQEEPDAEALVRLAPRLKARIRLTTRALWTNSGSLLEDLHKVRRRVRPGARRQPESNPLVFASACMPGSYDCTCHVARPKAG
jgi:hypothetical protein